MIRRTLLSCAVAATFALPVSAQLCEPNRTAAPKTWAPPLDRSITIGNAQLTLREALDRIAAAGRVKLSYSPQLLPLGSRVCIGYKSIALGDVLAAVLRGAAVEPVTGGSDQIVLAPVRQAAAAPQTPQAVEPVFSLPPVVALVSANAPTQSTEPTATTVVSGADISNRSNGSLSESLNGAVPGLWVWNSSPASLLTHYGSMRGASSFGLSAPKIYIDGIEVANPLLLSRITPDAIERIEVIRGPQGAALYGADAISGVTNIVTRHERIGEGMPRLRVRSSFGMSGTDYSPSAAFGQDHTLSFRTGADDRTAGFNIQFGSAGEYVPDAFARHFGVDGSVQWVGKRTVASGTARFSTQKSGSPLSPAITDAVSELSTFDDTRLSLQQYTVGARASYQHSDRWQHSIVAGIDGYNLDGIPDAGSFILSPVDSALRAAGAHALRTTLRLRSTAHVVNTSVVDASLAFAADHSWLTQQGESAVFGANPTWNGVSQQHGPRMGRPRAVVSYEHQPPDTEESRVNSGLTAQLNTSFVDRLHITGGIRLDRQSSTTLAAGTAVLPTIGMSYIVSGPVSLKLRGAYGKGIRWPQLSAQPEGWQNPHIRPVRMDLEPEQQDGIEAGFDLAIGRGFNLQVTRFDQTASGLIQRVAIAGTESSTMFDRPQPVSYQMQNVGRVTNNGWELQAAWQHGPFALAGTLSLVDSRVEQVASSYTGDLQSGDRMLSVPAQTIGLMAAWTGHRWSTSVSASRASDWINYDRIALASAYAASEPGEQLLGSDLRSFWRRYDGFTRLRAVVSHEVRRGLLLTLTGDNLLDYQIGEPDNATITPGRTLSIGFRTSF
jgi:outer membrane receptor protein involved in Fe transport